MGPVCKGAWAGLRAVLACPGSPRLSLVGVVGSHRLSRVLVGPVAGILGGALLLLACGARTGLLEGGPDIIDAPGDVVFNIPSDIPLQSDCPDAAATLVYVITQDDLLYSFYPPAAAFSLIGRVACPGSGGSAFSMAVDRAGIAYVLYSTGDIFRVDTATAACTPLPYAPGQSGFTNFGMGFAANGGASPSETLYIEGDTYFSSGGGEAPGLASLDTTTWTVTRIGSTIPPFAGGELTGTGDGELFTFFFYETDAVGARVGQLDKTTGQLLESVELAEVMIERESFAVAFWGGDFYLFTDGTVTKYSPGTGSTAVVANLDNFIVGAGVSTCAPQ
jgi:hypothetical protein